MRAIPIEERNHVEEPFVLVTYTTGFGQVPEKVQTFLSRNNRLLRGVSASGNRNWGTKFAMSADTISEMYGVPVITKFELSGTNLDKEQFVEGVRRIEAY